MQNVIPAEFAPKPSWKLATFLITLASLAMSFAPLPASPASPAGVNLVPNPSFETADPNDPSLADRWSKDKWGTNTTVFTYPVDWQDGERAAQVQITKYTNGDAKWTFAHVPVTSGATYRFSDYYKSDVGTELVAEYKKSNGAYAYAFLGDVPAAADWKQFTRDFVIPPGTQTATVYHLLAHVGTLSVDNVSFVAQDGGGSGSWSGTPPPTSGNLISNPSVEIASSRASIPDDWIKDDWGTLKAKFNYPIDGQDGRGARVEIASYTNGDAKWQFRPVPVTPGKKYEYSDYYQSNIVNTVTLEYKLSNGKYYYEDLSEIVPASAEWKKYSGTFTAPANASTVSVLHLISKTGYLNTDNFTLVAMDDGGSSGSGSTGSGSTWTGSTGSGSTGSGSTWTWSTGSGSTGSGDTIAPTVTLEVPPNGAILSGAIQFSATANDDTGVTKVRFIIDGSAVSTLMSGSGSKYSAIVDTTKLQNGQHSVLAEAYDAANNVGKSATATVTVSNAVNGWGDTAPPVVSITSPGSGSTLSWGITFLAHATDDIGVVSVKFLVDGTFFGTGSTGSGSSDYSLILDSTKLQNGSHTLTAEAYDAANNKWSAGPVDFMLNNPVLDTQPPTLSIASPVNGSTLSGAFSLSFNASDNVGIKLIHYSITNGADLISGEINQAPYTLQMLPSGFNNGTHTITAYAQDPAGNIGNAMPVSFETNNPPPTQSGSTNTGTNLILNPGFETSAGWLPEHWWKGGWGTNVASYAYPVAGIEGNSAAQITMSSRTDGDAKWYFDDVSVTPGALYTYVDKYKSTVPTVLTAQYTNTDGTYTYQDILPVVPASADWATVSKTFSIPPNASKITIFHLLNSVGTLTVDDTSLYLSGSGSSGPPGTFAFPTGMVTLTFDDGWGSQYDDALPMLNAAGIKGSFYIISNEMKNAVNDNRVGNASLEMESGSGSPAGWSEVKTGDNDAAFTYPVPGVSGSKAAKVEIGSYASGDAKWQFDDATVASEELYNFTDQYVATVPTTVTVVYKLTNGKTQTIDLGTVPASSEWSIASFTFTPPSNVESLTVQHRLTSAGMLTVDDFHLDFAQDYMNQQQIKEIYDSGHEVGTHTKTHPFLTTLSAAQAKDEIEGSRQDLINAGFTPNDTFVYPYGDYNDSVVQMVKDAGFIGARSVDPGYNDKATPKYALKIQEVNSSTNAQQWESWTQTAMQDKTWLIVMYHQIDHQNDLYGATPEELQTFINYLVANKIPTVTMEQGLKMMNP